MFVIIKFKFNLLIYNINNLLKNYYKSVCSVLIETIVHIYKVSLKKKTIYSINAQFAMVKLDVKLFIKKN